MEAAVRPRHSVVAQHAESRTVAWGAFDRDNNKAFFSAIFHSPDHNAMIDPSTADVTARVLECLGRYGLGRPDHPAVRRGLKFLLQDQCEDGSWFGRWGVNYVYGTSGRPARAGNYFAHRKRILPARSSLAAYRCQKSDGSFGESLPQL